MKKENQKKKERKETVSLIWGFLKGSRLFFAVSIISAALMALADMISPQIIRAAVDNAIGGNKPEFPKFVMSFVNRIGGFEYLGKNLHVMALAVVVVAAVKVLSQYAFRVFNAKGSETLVKNMRDTLYSHIERLPFSWHMKNKTGDIIQRCTSDIETLKRFISEQMTSIFRIVILLVLSVVFMLSMNIPLTLIAVIPMPIIILYSMYFHKNIRKGFRECDENEGKLSAMAQENLTGVRVVRAFGRESFEKERFEKHNEFYTGLWVRMAKLMSRFWATLDVLSGLQIMLIIVFGAVFCIKGQMTSGEYIAFISYNALLVWPIRMLGRMLSEMSKAQVAIERIKYITDTEEEKDKKGAVCADMSGDIEFKNVSFAYEGCPEILHDINLKIKSGTTLGILGGTGSGKTTLMLLLDKLYGLAPEMGQITVGGVDIADIKTEHLRKNIGIVLQEPYLFSGTILQNIGITSESIDKETVENAAKAACLDETVKNFASGYETFVGERGITLSGGQKQRCAIARVLTKKTPIMIFDDSLSAVDTETDAKIRASLEALFGEATIIIISHRITTLSKADNIIVLDKGRIIEEGPHEKLKSAGGIYQKIYEIQSGTGEEVPA
ncbi:MAG: ABC transporter ATP-binding protein [Ruminococcaceae bacterium]|nr:ABC transporter ATP-binding protein [Oscillospiraceae bacterium]